MSKLEYEGVVVPVLRYLNALPRSKAINTHGSVFFERGTPDVLGSISGRMVAFEAKRDTKERLRQIQRWRLSQWAAAGAVTGVVTSVEDVQRILAEHGLI